MRTWGESRRAKGMPRRSFVVVWVLVTTLLGLVVVPASASAPASAGAPVKVLITFAQPPGLSEQALVRGLGGEIKYSYRLVPGIAASVPQQALNGLRRNPRVLAIEPDLQATLQDAELDNAWGVKRIGAGAAHASGYTGDGVKVAILDTGIDLDHPDLAYDPACSASFVDGESLDDGYSHGTHIAGTVAGLDDEVGVVGVAPAAILCVYKVFSNAGTTNASDIIAALERAVTDGVQITNSSWGWTTDPGTLVQDAFDNAAAAGMLHVAAAGNYGFSSGTGENCLYPARWDSVIATAATMPDDTRRWSSSTCPELELAAPGEEIYSTMPGGGYGLKSGTSMASPHVVGSAALVWAANPAWSSSQVRAQLQASADDLGDPGRDTWYGYGLVDANGAVGLSSGPPSAAFSYTCTGLSCSFDASGSSDPGGTVVGYAWDFGDGGTGSGVTAGHSYGAAGTYTVQLVVTDDDGATDTKSQDLPVSGAMHVGDLDATKTVVRNKWDATVTITVHDPGGVGLSGATVSGTWSEGISGAGSCVTGAGGTCDVVQTGISGKVPSVHFAVESVAHAAYTYDAAYNHDPEGESDGTSIVVPPPAPPVNDPPVAAFSYSCTDLSCTFDASGSYDPDGEIVGYLWNFGDGYMSSGVITSHTYTAAGTYTVFLTVTDDDGATGTKGQNVTAGPPPNQPPVAAVKYSCTDLVCTFDASESSDPDGSIDAYDWNFGDGSTGSGVTANHAFAKAGTYTVVLTVTDDDGATDDDTQTVTVGDIPTMHVGDLDGIGQSVRTKWQATVTITVHDQDEQPLAGATVTGTWSGGATGGADCTTDASGQCSVVKSNLKTDVTSVTFTVDPDGVAAAGYSYEAAENHEDSITAYAP